MRFVLVALLRVWLVWTVLVLQIGAVLMGSLAAIILLLCIQNPLKAFDLLEETGLILAFDWNHIKEAWDELGRFDEYLEEE